MSSNNRRDPRRDPGQRGAAMLLVATLLVALLAGGGVALYLQLQSTKSATMTKISRNSLFCAEAGVVASRQVISERSPMWSVLLDADASNDPSWYPFTGDIDGDGENDYEVTIRDNDDEVPPAVNDTTADVDGRVFAIGRCIRNTDVSREVIELLVAEQGNYVYRNQAGGGAWNTGNRNQ